MGDLVEDAYFGERERALEQTFAQHADLPGVETVEGAHGGDCGVHNVTLSNIYLTLSNTPIRVPRRGGRLARPGRASPACFSPRLVFLVPAP